MKTRRAFAVSARETFVGCALASTTAKKKAMSKEPWTQDGIDNDMLPSWEPDVCHHGVGFDEECEDCNDENDDDEK